MHLVLKIYLLFPLVAAVAVDLTQTSLDLNFLTAASDLYVFIFIFFLLIIIRAESSKSGNSAIHTMFFFLIFHLDCTTHRCMNVWPLWTFFLLLDRRFFDLLLIIITTTTRRRSFSYEKMFGLYEKPMNEIGNITNFVVVRLISSSSWFCWCYIFLFFT